MLAEELDKVNRDMSTDKIEEKNEFTETDESNIYTYILLIIIVFLIIGFGYYLYKKN